MFLLVVSGMFRGVANTKIPFILERFGPTRIYPNGTQHSPTRRSDATIRHDTVRLFVHQAKHDTNRHEILFWKRNTNLHETDRTLSSKHEFTRNTKHNKQSNKYTFSNQLSRNSAIWNPSGGNRLLRIFLCIIYFDAYFQDSGHLDITVAASLSTP